MGTTRSFSAMINEHITDKLLTEELIKRDWFFSNVEMITDHKGGDVIVPFEGNSPNSITFGGLTAATDIAEGDYQRGKESGDFPEAWASLILNQRDLQEHDGKIPEQTFLRLVPDQLDKLMANFREALSYQFMGGPAICTITDDTNAATGVLVVDRIERLMLRQKVMLKDGDTAAAAYYVTKIDLNSSEVTLSATRGGAAADVSAYSVAQSAKLYHPGGDAGTFLSMRQAFLPSALGGSDTLHGKTKADFPYLQTIRYDGSGVTSSNIVDKLFDFYLTVRQKARGNASKLLMDFRNWGYIMKSQQISKGAYKVVSEPKKAEYGWWETTIASTTNGQSLDIVAIQEHDTDIIQAFDPGTVKIFSNGGVKKHKTPDGNVYYVVRNTTGYQYIVDLVFRGQAIYSQPSNNGIMHSIPTT